MRELLKTSDHIVTQEAGRITITPRYFFLAFFGGIFLLIAAALFFPARAFFGEGIGEKICFWVSLLFALFAALYLGKALFRAFVSRPFVLNSAGGFVTLGKDKYFFRDLTPPEITEYRIADMPIYKMVMALGGENRTLIMGVDKGRLSKLRNVATEIGDGIKTDFSPDTDEKIEPRLDQAVGARMENLVVGLILLLLGVIWSTIGFFVFPDYVFTAGTGADFGTLIWPLGIWLSIPGILQLMGVPVYDFMKSDRSWKQYLIFALWFGSYFIVCFRSIN